MSVNLFDITLQLNGYPIQKARNKLKEIQSIPEANYKNYVDSAKGSIFDYHIKHNRFYKSLVRTQSINEWDQIPIMTKKHLQRPLKDRLSDSFDLRKVYMNKTSGSSGDPFYFVKDKFCHAMTWAVIQNRFSWYSIDFNTSLQARFFGIPLDKKGFYKERIKDIFSRRHRFSVFDLSDNALDKVLDKFKNTAFDYVNGYTSALVLFAKFLDKKGLILKEICPTLKCCMATSEMLFEDDKQLLKNRFGIPIINEYGASELDLIAFQHPNGKWQINSETLYLEVLDEEGKKVPDGDEGRLVITSLFNKAHPFIRYDIGDIGTRSKKSTSKFPVLERISGRNNDIISLPSGRKAAGLTFYYITKQILNDDGRIKEFVIEQTSIDTFKVIYISTDEIGDIKRKEIREAMSRYLEQGLTIKFEKQHIIKRSQSGKLKQFISNLDT